MQAVKERARKAGYTLLGSGGLEYLERTAAKVRHGDRTQLVLVDESGEVDPHALASSVEDTAREIGFAPPDGEDVMSWVDPHGQVHLRIQERTPEMTALAPILLLGMAGLPLLFFLFREDQQEEGEQGLKKWMPFIVLGGIVVLGIGVAMVAGTRKT